MIQTMTDDDINALAKEIYRERVFTTDHVRPEDMKMLPMIFMPLIFANKKLIEEMMQKEPEMIYEHLSEAGRLSINGYPSFVSLHLVSREDAKRVREKVKQIKKAVEGVIKHGADGIEA